MVLVKDEVYYIKGTWEHLFRCVNSTLLQVGEKINLINYMGSHLSLSHTEFRLENYHDSFYITPDILRVATIKEIRHFLACEKAGKYVDPHDVKQETEFKWY